jgi:ABC-type polar amino acid transport system ATPase subunit
MLEFRRVEKQYGGLRPLRIRDLRVETGDCVMLLGFDRPAAEIFINLATGASLPEQGDVLALGRLTRDIADSGEWLTFVEQFGIVSDRIVLLEGMTVAQNLAISFDLELDPIPAEVLPRVQDLGARVHIGEADLRSAVAEAGPSLRARVLLARALAFNPVVLLLEHPTAALSPEQSSDYATVLKAIGKSRELAIVGLTADEKFAKETGGRLLVWQPATGAMRTRRSIFGR